MKCQTTFTSKFTDAPTITTPDGDTLTLTETTILFDVPEDWQPLTSIDSTPSVTATFTRDNGESVSYEVTEGLHNRVTWLFIHGVETFPAPEWFKQTVTILMIDLKSAAKVDGEIPYFHKDRYGD